MVLVSFGCGTDSQQNTQDGDRLPVAKQNVYLEGEVEALAPSLHSDLIRVELPLPVVPAAHHGKHNADITALRVS